MKKNPESGFSLIELLITMTIFVFVIVAASSIFTNFLSTFKQQSKIAESNIEGVVGLELLRTDIEQAGFGIPWSVTGINYNEAVNDGNTFQIDTAYNDSPNNPPRAFVHGEGDGINRSGGAGTGSDVMVIKATNVAVNDAAQRFTYIINNDVVNLNPVVWADPNDNLAVGNNVILTVPIGAGGTRSLITSGGAFYRTYAATAAGFGGFQPPLGSFSTHLVYGINGGNPALRFPFNRADYYIRRPTTAGSMPSQCFPGGRTVAGATYAVGILYKATVNHENAGNPGGHAELPLLDCVADFQVDFARDTNNDGAVDAMGIGGLTAENIRDQVRQAQVYILAHEGQFDPEYTFTNFTGSAAAPFLNICPGACATCVMVGNPATCAGRNFDLSRLSPGSTLYQNYRWKIFSMVLKPFNLR